MGVTLHKILQLPAFQGAKILAGASAQNNIVKGISMLEAPDSARLISGNDLVITNTYFFNSVKDKAEKIMRLLSAKGCSGIALKLNRYMSNVPDIMLKMGNELPLPVVSLPFEAPSAQVINTIIYEIMHDEFFKASSGYEETFLKDLLFANYDREAIIKRAQLIGWRLDYKPALLLIWPHNKERIKGIYNICRKYSSDTDYVYIHGSYIIVILDVSKLENRWNSVMDIANNLRDDISGAYNYQDFHIGVGRCYEDFTNIARSYYEAKTSMEVAHFSGSGDIVSTFDSLGIYRILFDLKNQAELKLFYEETVGRIVDFDREHNTEYLKTIETYLNQKGSIRDTADAMYVHYNTIRYRLRKIHELIGIDLTDDNNRFNLTIGIRIAKFYMYQQEND